MTELLYMHQASEQKLQTSVVGLPLTKTLVDESLLQDYPVSARHPRFLAYLEKSAEQQLESNMQDAVLRLHARGVTLLVGSDAANLAMFQGVGFHRELFHLARFGLSPWQLFKAATLDAYAFLGIDWQIKVGADAHFTLQDPEIFTDVAKSTEVQQVYLYGRLVEREALLDYAKPGFIQYAKLFLGFER
jgi:imidazolonepropionase-like amidohydrolase